MKHLKIICSLLTGFILLVSCIKEDRSNCPQNNLTLNFHYLGDTRDPSMFDQKIQRVTIFVFNKSGQNVLIRTLDKKDLTTRSATLKLPPAQIYDVICWANAFDESTVITRGTQRKDYRVHHPGYGARGAKIQTNDPLYVSHSISIPIPGLGMANGDIYFKGAHNRLEIYIDNFGQKNDPATYPVVEVSGLMPEYDLEINSKAAATYTYYPVTKLDKTHDMLAAKLQTLQFDDNNPVVITVKDPLSAAVRHTFNLTDYMTTHAISIDGKNERTISVQIRFSDLGVTVTVPAWEIIDIKP